MTTSEQEDQAENDGPRERLRQLRRYSPRSAAPRPSWAGVCYALSCL